MAEYMTLMGAEQVQRASNAISQAAEDMKRAASMIDESVHQLGRVLGNFSDNMASIMHRAETLERNRHG